MYKTMSVVKTAWTRVHVFTEIVKYPNCYDVTKPRMQLILTRSKVSLQQATLWSINAITLMLSKHH